MNIDDIAKLIEERTGLLVRYNFKNILFEIINGRISMLGLNLDDYYEIIEQNIHDEFNNVVDQLTIKDTYFFRNIDIYENLRIHIIPQMLNKYEKVRIWDLGCATGEEPYSIAMLIDYFYPEFKNRFDIYACDISINAINDAKLGVYDRFSFKTETPITNYQSLYFFKRKNLYSIKGYIKKMVNFEQFNLMDIEKSKLTNYYNVILCKNVFIYMKKEASNMVLENINRLLKNDGILFIGAGEALYGEKHIFDKIYSEDGFYYVKRNKTGKDVEEIYEKIMPGKGGERGNYIGIDDIMHNYRKKEYSTVLSMIRYSYKDAPEKERKIMNMLFAFIMFNIGKYEYALETIKNNLGNYNDNEYIWIMYIYGHFNLLLGNDKKAKEIFDVVIKERKRFVPALLDMANIYFDEENYIKSKEIFLEISDLLGDYKENKLFTELMPELSLKLISEVVKSRLFFLQQLVG